MAPSTGLGTRAPDRDSRTAESARTGSEASFLNAVRLGADTLCRLAAEPEWSGEQADALARLVAERGRVELELARTVLCSRALREPRLQALPPQLAAEALVRILAALAPVRGVSLWISTERAQIACAVALGEAPDRRHVRRAALAVLAGRRPSGPTGLFAVPVRCWERPAAALVVLADPSRPESAEKSAAEAASALRIVLEREALLDRGQERERLLVEASERRLARLAFDIHDGALQTIASLGLELRLLGAELEQRDGDEWSTRVGALEERAAALETELRHLTHSLEPSGIARRPLEATLAEQVSAFGAQHGVATRFEALGDLTGLTPSQRIALVRVVGEALTNAREHGRADGVRILLRADGHGVRVHVADDGCGFDVGTTLPAAARRGRLGLVGMSERVRLLGGRLDVESRPGGPTAIVAFLPRWRPVAEPATPAAVATVP